MLQPQSAIGSLPRATHAMHATRPHRTGCMSLENSLSPLATPSFPVATHDGEWDRDSFWAFADAAKAATEALAAQKMKALEYMPVHALREFCTQYRFFTIEYIRDLALLLAKLPFGGLRSLLSQILSEELGEGDASRAHPAIYDRFLASIGVPPERLDRGLQEDRRILGALTNEMWQRVA